MMTPGSIVNRMYSDSIAMVTGKYENNWSQNGQC